MAGGGGSTQRGGLLTSWGGLGVQAGRRPTTAAGGGQSGAGAGGVEEEAGCGSGDMRAVKCKKQPCERTRTQGRKVSMCHWDQKIKELKPGDGQLGHAVKRCEVGCKALPFLLIPWTQRPSLDVRNPFPVLLSSAKLQFFNIR
ncbi:hypothetical protein AV530_008643 [Patagioenas fasciata monilis]|uniref:Uncharacterized protein n=1 Tax=Patagioenas fasciata monilis TaxID=372326 RepID=A0A1V4L0T5_PATFA|nr:hypothetical protein AV530_008643 [Patagioenas fasciata monilis]